MEVNLQSNVGGLELQIVSGKKHSSFLNLLLKMAVNRRYSIVSMVTSIISNCIQKYCDHDCTISCEKWILEMSDASSSYWE